MLFSLLPRSSPTSPIPSAENRDSPSQHFPWFPSLCIFFWSLLSLWRNWPVGSHLTLALALPSGGVGNNAGISRTGDRYLPSGLGQAFKLSWLSSAVKLRRQGLPRMTMGDACNGPRTALGFGAEYLRHANLPEPGPHQNLWLLPLAPRPEF